MPQTPPPGASNVPSTARSRWQMSHTGASSPRPSPRRTQKAGSEGKTAAGCHHRLRKDTTRSRASSRSFNASIAWGRVGAKATRLKDQRRK
eukprot:15464429-Alexandrium_andersonii.AAC.1